MKTLLICTDFSEVAMHAARYGCLLAKEYKFQSITLFHAYASIIVPTTLPLTPGPLKELHKSFMDQLKDLQQQLKKEVDNTITIKIRAEDISFAESIDRISMEENADMIIMGIRGKSGLEKTLIGSNAAIVAENSKYPVMIVPAQSPLQPIQSVLFACDLRNFSKTTPLGSLEKILHMFHVPLFVVNVDNKERQFSPQTPEEIRQLHHIFDKYKANYAFIDRKETVDGILGFAKENAVSVIITIRKNYNFFQKLFHKSTTEKLIFHSDIPLLSLHE